MLVILNGYADPKGWVARWESIQVKYDAAAALATQYARADSEDFRRGLAFQALGTAVGDDPDGSGADDFNDPRNLK